jgi:hypothetical protein
MGWHTRILFGVVAMIGIMFSLLGAWIFFVTGMSSPTTMLMGAATLLLTAIAWRQHRR